MTMVKQARLHEESVKGAQELVGSFAGRKSRAKGSRSSRARQEVVVHPLVMAKAKELLEKRPGTKLRIIDASTVVVE